MVDILTLPSQIEAVLATTSLDNDAFAEAVRESSVNLDDSVFAIAETITPLIDCTKCGNCCKSLMVNITEDEANVVSKRLSMTRSAFDEKYLEKGFELMIMNKMPCHFLEDNACTIYPDRFSGCHEFPALHLPDFKKRIFTTMMHYERCPIIFNVVEELKVRLRLIS